MKVLLAADHESFNEAIADFVINRSWETNTIFRIVNVVPAIYEYAYASSVPELMMDLRADAKNNAGIKVRHMALKLRDHFHLDNIQEVILEGHPAEMLLEHAEQWHADLIIMGSHGRTGLKKFLMGSVSSAVLDHSPCSVIIVRQKETQVQNNEMAKEKEEARV